MNMKLYYHKTDGGAEYLTDKFVVCPNGHKEGIFNGAKYVVRIDGDITKDAELSIAESTTTDTRLIAAAPMLLKACKRYLRQIKLGGDTLKRQTKTGITYNIILDAVKAAELE
jgi:hypothetical protein